MASTRYFTLCAAVGLQIWIPESARPEPRRVFRCEVPGCKKRFPLEQREQMVRHVKACAKRHEGEIAEALHNRRSDGFLSPLDPEQAEYVRRRAFERKEVAPIK